MKVSFFPYSFPSGEAFGLISFLSLLSFLCIKNNARNIFMQIIFLVWISSVEHTHKVDLSYKKDKEVIYDASSDV